MEKQYLHDVLIIATGSDIAPEEIEGMKGSGVAQVGV